MARSTEEIRDAMLTAKSAEANLSDLDSTSQTAIWRLFIYIVAGAIHLLEVLFDTHKDEVDQMLLDRLTHTLQWYVTKAKAFQYGDSLLPDSDQYAAIDATKQIIKYAAVEETNGSLLLKVAKETGGNLAALSAQELTSFIAYMTEVKDAGVYIDYVSSAAIELNIELTVYYDPMVLSATGLRLSGSGYPVTEAINTYLANLPFNGQFIRMKLIDALQAADGVEIAEITTSEYNNGSGFVDTGIKLKPASGYMALNDLTVTYIANV
jgi:hypothetical protein